MPNKEQPMPPECLLTAVRQNRGLVSASLPKAPGERGRCHLPRVPPVRRAARQLPGSVAVLFPEA